MDARHRYIANKVRVDREGRKAVLGDGPVLPKAESQAPWRLWVPRRSSFISRSIDPKASAMSGS